MAGMMAIPRDIEEAALVDGAGFWRRTFEVSMPLTLPVMAVAALFGAIFTFTDMTVVYVLTRGGPTDSTQVLASWAFTKRGNHAVTLRLAERLLTDPHDLMHKAVGWMLREVAHRDREAAERFLRRHCRTMPRTMLRYAIEKLPEPVRRRYLAGDP